MGSQLAIITKLAMPDADVWEPVPWDNEYYLIALDVLSRPVIRTGRLSDILLEGQPAFVESPQGKSIYWFDGKGFLSEVKADEATIFDRGWKVRHGLPRLKMVAS